MNHAKMKQQKIPLLEQVTDSIDWQKTLLNTVSTFITNKIIYLKGQLLQGDKGDINVNRFFSCF